MKSIKCLPLQVVCGILLASLLCFPGCGGGEPFQPMSGRVLVDDQPLAKGVITFFPNGAGTTVGGQIIDGGFNLERESGATPGNYRVEIVAFRPSGKKEFDIDEQAEVDVEVQYLPKKYNSQSELTADVTADGANEFEFKLSSK
jgi:hypothetical protein